MNLLIVVLSTVAKMKGFALVLLCALVAVQARYASVVSEDDSAVSQSAPWIVHLRIAVSTSGLLDTTVGTLINSNWALTTSSGISDVRFIWARFGLRNNDVISPSLVYELGVAAVNLHPNYNAATGENNIGLLQIARGAGGEAGISPVGLPLPGAALPSSGTFCSFGETADGAPGVTLGCIRVDLVEGEGNFIVPNIIGTAQNDLGAGIIADDTVVGFLSGEDKYTSTAAYVDWIEATSGVSFSPDGGDADADDSDAYRVRVVDN